MNKERLQDIELELEKIIELASEIEEKKKSLKGLQKGVYNSLRQVIEVNTLKPKVIELLEIDRTNAAARNYYSRTLVKHKFWNLEFIKLIIGVLKSELSNQKSEEGSSGANSNLRLAATG